jgi:hypothetical protein
MAGEPFDAYADGVQVAVSPFTVILAFTVAPAGGQPGTVTAVRLGDVRMSHEHAKVMAIVLRKQIKAYEEQVGEIPLHNQVWNQLGLSRQDDW